MVLMAMVACGDRTATPPAPTTVAPLDAAAPTVDAAAPRAAWTGPSCGTAHVPLPDRDGAPMCLVPAATFIMGSDRPGDLPPRPVRITRDLAVDQYEVTIEQFLRFANAHDNRCARDHAGDTACANRHDFEIVAPRLPLRPKPAHARQPIYVTYQRASEYCAWVGKRLPTEAEWLLAALRDPATGATRVFPWGDTFRKGIMNCGEDPGECEDGTRLNSPVGAFPSDVSATGILDLGGNVDEWVRDCWTANPQCDGTPCTDPLFDDGCHRDGGLPGELNRGVTFTSGPDDFWVRRPSKSPALISGFRCVTAPD